VLDLAALLDRLREEGGDLPGVEVKSAAGGLPVSLITSLCAFANRPGGGVVVLGLDEATGFHPVELGERSKLKRALADKARTALQPPLVLEFSDATLEGVALIVATVTELDDSQKPCRVKGGQHQGTWIRSTDGDYRASEIEIQALLARRSQPFDDAFPAGGSTRADLDSGLVSEFLRSCREMSTQLAKLPSDDELLYRTGVLVSPQEVPTVAGILALGIYPQQFLPSAALQAVLVDDSDPSRRVLDSRRFDGPIPHIVNDAVQWVARVGQHRIRNGDDGRVLDEPMWPLDAVRELIANALVHRAYSPWAMGETAMLRISRDRLVVKNPGSLYGLSTERLGQTGVTSARNANLIRICQYVQLPGAQRTVEALATGIPTVINSLHRSQLPPPLFDDDGVRFTVVLRQTAEAKRVLVDPASPAAKVLRALSMGPQDIDQLVNALGSQAPALRKQLRALRALGLVEQHGGPGLKTTYSRVAK
jgi:ATP-dependent DNA helicase RecG